MRIFILLYLVPGIITTFLLPKFINYNGGTEYLKQKWEMIGMMTILYIL